MKNKNTIIALAISASFVFAAPNAANAAEITIDTIGIDQNRENFNWDHAVGGDLEITATGLDTFAEETVVFTKDSSKTQNTKLNESEILTEVTSPSKDNYKSNLSINKVGNNYTLYELYNPKLSVNGTEALEGNINGTVKWGTQDEKSIDFSKNTELPHTDGNDENAVPFVNNTPKITLNGQDVKSGKVLVNDEKGELRFNVDENYNPNYTLIEGNDGKLYYVDKFSSNAIDGTNVEFADANKSGAEARTKNDLDNLYNEKNNDSVKIIDIELPYNVIEKEVWWIPKGERRLITKGEKGKGEIHVKPGKENDDNNGKIVTIKHPVNEIWAVGKGLPSVCLPEIVLPPVIVDPVPAPGPTPVDPIVDVPVVDPTPTPVPTPQPEKEDKDYSDLINKIEETDEEIKKEITVVDSIKDDVKKPVDDNTNEETKKPADNENKKPSDEATKAVKETVVVKVPEVKEQAAKSPKAAKSSNPKTGISGLAGVVATLSAATAGLFASKKRK